MCRRIEVCGISVSPLCSITSGETPPPFIYGATTATSITSSFSAATVHLSSTSLARLPRYGDGFPRRRWWSCRFLMRNGSSCWQDLFFNIFLDWLLKESIICISLGHPFKSLASKSFHSSGKTEVISVVVQSADIFSCCSVPMDHHILFNSTTRS